MNSTEQTPIPPPEVAFTLDLGANGGVLAPHSPQELIEWVQKEQNFFSWVTSQSGGNHRNAIDQALNPLHQAVPVVQQAMGFAAQQNADGVRNSMEHAQNLLRQAYVNNAFPHSSSLLGKRVDEIRTRSVLEAQAYLYVFLNSQGHHFTGGDIASWRGFVAGLIERYGLSSFPPEAHQAAVGSFEALCNKTEELLGEKTAVIEALHREYASLRSAIESTDMEHKKGFEELSRNAQQAHESALKTHQDEMATLQKTFRESMTLRAPVEYWGDRKTHHETRAVVLGRWAFGSLAGLGVILGAIGYWVFSTLPQDGKPESWKVALMVLVGILGVWTVRLIVRMFLSHTHLATDAAERVTMVKTYLSLLEGAKLPSDDDRKLVLQTLFRTASDGIVKDEGIPHPGLDFLTKIGGGRA